MKKKKSNIKNNVSIVVVTMSFLFFITMAGFYLFNWYININIHTSNPKQYDAQKISVTIEQEKEENKTVTQMLEEVSRCVVGISKLRDNGSSVFLKDGTTKLGLGTGMIVSQDGYILTNEHVSGAKFNNCYVTLENGKTYTANVVWSDTDLDLSIIKINVIGLPYVKLGDSEQVQVGEKVYAIRKSHWI